MSFGEGKFTYEYAPNWAGLTDGYHEGWIPGVAVDSKDRVFIYSRSEKPLNVYDTDGNHLARWGEGVLQPNAAHGREYSKSRNDAPGWTKAEEAIGGRGRAVAAARRARVGCGRVEAATAAHAVVGALPWSHGIHERAQGVEAPQVAVQAPLPHVAMDVV